MFHIATVVNTRTAAATKTVATTHLTTDPTNQSKRLHIIYATHLTTVSRDARAARAA